MADTALVLSDVRTKLFEELGSPAQDLPDTGGGILDTNLEFAARRILRYLSYNGTGEDAKVGTFTTVADQQTYAVPADVVIQEVFWNPSGLSDVDIDPYARQFGQIPGSSLAAATGTRGYYWRSDQLIADMKEVQIESRYRWEVIDGSIYLYPVPTSALTIRYIYSSTAGGVTNLDIEHELALIYLSASYCARIFANRTRGAGQGFTQIGIQDANKSQEWDDLASRYWDLFQIELQELI